MYARNGANGGEEAEGFKQENGYLVGTPGWSCTTLCGVEHSTSDADGTFFPPSADQNQSTKHKNVLGSDFCSDIFSGSENNTRIGLWIPRFVTSGMGNLDLQADRVTSNVIQLMDSSTAAQNEKKKVAAARKSKRCSKGSGSGNSSNKDLMEVYRISRPSGSKDRHSKVATAKGPRDRRMRLSVETAVKFFHVQDRLGFDQPSKAVEWLIDKCSSAIDELPHISHSESLPDFKSLSTPCMNSSAAELIMNCERDQRKRSRSSKLISTCSPNVKELKTKAKERDQEGSKRRRKGQAKLSSVQVNQRPVETMSFRQGLLHMHSHDLSGIRSFESRHKTPYFNCAQYSPEIAFQSYPSSSVQSAESFSGRDSTTTTTTFSVPSSCPFPRVMPSISIDPQSNISEF